MDRLTIEGGRPLKGDVHISGAKNAALPLMAACLLSDQPLTLSNLPHLADIASMANLLGQLGVTLSLDGQSNTPGGHTGNVLTLQANQLTSHTAPYELVRKMRASVLVLGPLLARFHEARVSLPGGCAIGARPIDLHLHALEQLGATITLEDGYVHAAAPGGLKGGEVHFAKVSVGATENTLMAASLAHGTTTLYNAAREPEIGDLIRCLQSMGAEIEGIDTDRITIHGKPTLHGAHHRVVADRIEMGTYAVAAAMTHGHIRMEGGTIGLLGDFAERLTQSGAKLTPHPNALEIDASHLDRPHAVDVETHPFPGFATDMQAQFMALMAVASGACVITESIFENRFMHVPELTRMGADITLRGHTALVRGVPQLSGAEVMATDLRASSSLILAALAAKGTTTVHRIYHLDRGYEQIEEKLSRLGASIERVHG